MCVLGVGWAAVQSVGAVSPSVQSVSPLEEVEEAKEKGDEKAREWTFLCLTLHSPG